MQMTQSFKEIMAWQKAHSFVVMVYKACAGGMQILCPSFL